VHKLIARQITKASKEAGQIDLDLLAELVSGAYEQADQDRRRTDRSISLMIEELDRLNRGLERLVEERTAALREREDELRAQNLRFDAALNNMSQALLMFDSAARLVICNQRYHEMYGLPPAHAQPGVALRDLLELRRQSGSFADHPDDYVANLMATIAEGKTWSQLTELPDGRTVVVVNHPMPGGGWVATHEDITERRRAEKQIAHMARHDALTDLPNRVLLRERLAHALATLPEGERLAVLYLDLDHFKSVNDTLGHQIGDELLKAVAERLRKCVHEADTVARVGGDEFAIIQAGIQQPTDTAVLARRICETVKEPFDLGGHAVIAETSIGIALAPSDGTEPNELLKNADMALYGAKADGRGTYRFFEPEMDARMKTRRSLELALRKGLANGQFELHYQPLVSLEDRRITCCEALLRWQHPERGLVSPADFIPIAEEIGLIIPLGEWVLSLTESRPYFTTPRVKSRRESGTWRDSRPA
jgi:diguanylate cyclase (GGDEF)-like protein